MYAIWEYRLRTGQTDCRSLGQMPDFNGAVRVMLLRRDVLCYEGYANLLGENQIHTDGIAFLIKTGETDTAVILRVEKQ